MFLFFVKGEISWTFQKTKPIRLTLSNATSVEEMDVKYATIRGG